MSKEYKNYIQLENEVVGGEKRLELMKDVLDGGTFLPKTLLYKDIDEAVKKWVDEKLKIISDDGKEFKTMSLFSNQRFSEYSQSWKYTDDNNNLLLNFKTITRDNNPQQGTMFGKEANIPGDNRFYTMKQQLVLDDNGSESYLVLKMKQPTTVDFIYHVSIFTNKYDKINEFNQMINKEFNATQRYIFPNGHYIPMVLDTVSDESSYQIDDRQFYGQTFNVKVMGYIITEDDYRIEEVPYKRGVSLSSFSSDIMRQYNPSVDIEECGDNISIICEFSEKCKKNTVSFTNDTKFTISKIELDNIRNNYKIYVGGNLISLPFTLEEGNEEIKILITKVDSKQSAKISLKGEKKL